MQLSKERKETQADRRTWVAHKLISEVCPVNIKASLPIVDALAGALASVGEEDVEDVPRRVRGANGGRMTRARGVQGRGAAPRYRFFRFITQAFIIMKLC